MRSTAKILSVFAIAFVAALAFAQDAAIPPIHRVTLFSATAPASGLTNSAAATPIDIPPKTILAIQASILGGGVDRNTGAVVFRFDTSIDGSNWTTNAPYQGSVLADMTNTVTRMVTVGTNIPARFVKLSGIQNAHTNAVTITNFAYVFIPTP